MGSAGSFPGCEDKGCEFMRVEKKTRGKGKTEGEAVGYNGCHGHSLSHLIPNENAVDSALSTHGNPRVPPESIPKLTEKFVLIGFGF